MRFFISSLCVGFGGGLGGLARHASMQTLRVAGLPEYSALMVVNVCGCFLIGAALHLARGVAAPRWHQPPATSSYRQPV